MWSPGHSGTQGNKTADCLAKVGANKTFVGPEPSVGLSQSHLRTGITAWENKCKEEAWESSIGFRQAKRLLSYKIIQLGDVINMDRNRLRSITWYLTVHGPFNGHLNKIGKSPTDRCRFYGTERETSEHILFLCEAVAL